MNGSVHDDARSPTYVLDVMIDCASEKCVDGLDGHDGRWKHAVAIDVRQSEKIVAPPGTIDVHVVMADARYVRMDVV